MKVFLLDRLAFGKNNKFKKMQIYNIHKDTFSFFSKKKHRELKQETLLEKCLLRYLGANLGILLQLLDVKGALLNKLLDNDKNVQTNEFFKSNSFLIFTY